MPNPRGLPSRNTLNWTVMVGLLATGCTVGIDGKPQADPALDESQPMPEPSVLTLSKSSISVGEELTLRGQGFVDDARGHTVVVFRGRFTAEDGSVDNVDLTVAPVVVSPEEVRWPQFGPHRVPFTTAGNEIGLFEGRIFASNRRTDGSGAITQAEPLEASLEVEPSVVVREFQPDTAACAVVASSVINLLPYRLQVEALGFEPVRFRYVVSPGAISDPGSGSEGSTSELVREHEATGTVDSLHDSEWIRFAGVPYGLRAYRGSVSILVEGAAGEEHELAIRLTVRRPLEVYFRDAVEPAEIYEPVPVSGCVPGGLNGRAVNYAESHSETRERSFEIGWQQDWQTSYTSGYSESYTEGNSESNRIGFETSDGTNWHWDVNGEVYGEGGVSLIAQGKAGFKVGGEIGRGGDRTVTNARDRAWEESHSFGEAIEESATISAQEGASGSEQWLVSSSDSQALEYSAFLLPNKFGVFYRQTTRLVRSGQVVAYDLCGDAIPVGDLALDDYTWAPELAVSNDCPPFPESSFPDAQCLSPPCEDSF